MKKLKNRFYWSTSSLFLLLFAISLPAEAFTITLDTDASVGQVYDDVDADSTINTTNTPDGFGNYDGSSDNFFESANDPFILLGSEPDEAISANSNPPLVETNIAIFNGIEITTENQSKDLLIEFDWIFQGNQQEVAGFDLDIFTVALVGTGTNPLGGTVNVDLELLATNQYNYDRDYSYIVEGGLSVGSYTLKASVIESIDIPLIDLSVDNSAAGLANISVTAIPFEFSPTFGLLTVVSLWGLSRLWKHKINSSKN